MFYVFGDGGFTLQVMDTLEALPGEVVIVSDHGGDPVCGLRHIVSDELPDAPMAIAVARPEIRRNIAERHPRPGLDLRASTARVSRHAEIGEGHILCHNTLVEAGAKIGRHFHANIYSYVAHECVIGDFVTFAPRVSCNGNIHIGDGVHIWTGAMIRNGSPARPLVIGAGAVIGMGAVVTKDVPPHTMVFGNPARVVPFQRLRAAH